MDACVICTRLHTCSDVTETRVLSGPLCPLVLQTPDAAVSARLRILDDFGPTYLLHLKDHSPMNAAQEEDLRSPLRQIATTLGLVPGGVAGFRIKYAEYIEKLRPQFPEIGALSDNNTLSVPYLNNILNGLKGGTVVSEPVVQQAAAPARTPVVVQAQPAAPQAEPVVAPDAGGKRRPGRKPKGTEDAQPAVVVEPEPVVAPEPVRTPVVQTAVVRAADPEPTLQSQAGAPVRRAPGGFRKPGDVAPETVKTPNIDLGGIAAQFADLKGRIDYLGAASDDQAKSIKVLKDVASDLETLEARVEGLAVALTWLYNQSVAEEDAVASIEEIDFEGG